MLNKIFQISIHILVSLNIVVIYSLTIHQINGNDKTKIKEHLKIYSSRVFNIFVHLIDFNNITNVSLTSDMELMMISEELYNKFSYELSNNVHINYQGQINFNNFSDNAPQRYFLNFLF